MSAQIISGKDIANEIRAELTTEVARLKDEAGVTPGLATVLVGDDPASQMYVGMKNKAAAAMGIHSRQITLPADTDADFRLKTMSGDIDSELPKGSSSDYSASGMRELRFRNKKGAGRVQVSSFSGDIELEAR